MSDIDCGQCDCDCGGCDCGGCDCGAFDCGDIDCGQLCLSLSCCEDGGGGGGGGCDSYCCFFLGRSSSVPSGHRSNSSGENCSLRCLCCCWVLTLLLAVAFILTMAFAFVHPVRVAVEDASLARLALAGPNGTALAYDVSLAIAVRNRNWAMRAEPGDNAPLVDGELLFAGVPFAHVRMSSRGAIMPGKTEVYLGAAAGESVPLGSSELAEFVKESAAGGAFRLELKLTGEVRYPPHRDVHMVNVTCPLELPLSSATTAVARFTKVKCA